MFEYEEARPSDVLGVNFPDDESSSEFDWEFIRTIFNLTSFVYPMNRRRIITWFCYLFIGLGYYVLDKETNFSEKLMDGLQKQINILTFLTYGLEPGILLFYMILAKYPYFEPNSSPMLMQEKIKDKENEDAVLIIPCHLSASSRTNIKSLKRILHAGLKHFSPSHIFIIDNGRSPEAPDPTYRVVKEVHPSINYKYYANPNKTTALYVGLKMAQYIHGDKIKYGLFIDDDVEIPENFQLKRVFFEDPTVRGLIYPIRATSASRNNSRLIDWQDIEYHIADIALAAADVSKSAVAPHGACMVLEINTADKIFERHTGLFKGEDKEVGERLRHMYDTAGLLKFRVDMTCHFKTNAPESYFGKGGNLWGQRVRSWSEAPFLYFWRLTLRPLIMDWPVTPLALIVTKLDQAYHFVSQLSHIFRYLLMASQANRPIFWVIYSSLLIAQLAAVMVFNFQKLPPYLRNDFKSVLTFPIYKQIDGFLAHIAFWRVLLVSFPQETSHPPIKNLLDLKLIPPVDFSDLDIQKIELARESDEDISEIYDSWYTALNLEPDEYLDASLGELYTHEKNSSLQRPNDSHKKPSEEERELHLRQLKLFGFNHKKKSPTQKVSNLSEVSNVERSVTV
ncbi:MAG: glycosyltransferase family 2 protein [Legionellaceae bacterium]|nr:glycosyltransferase family 2 protein [Legionellaceae bacterium]